MSAPRTAPTDVPAGYRLHATLDLKEDPRAAAVIQVGFASAVAALIAVALLLDLPFDGSWHPAVVAAITAAACVAYMVVHEATHGTALWWLTKVRPTFAVRLPYLVTGSPALISRRQAIAIALAPVVLWGLVLLTLLRDLPAELFLTVYVVLVLNVAGSAGDALQAYAFARLPADALIRDDGRVTTVYLPDR